MCIHDLVVKTICMRSEADNLWTDNVNNRNVLRVRIKSGP